MNFLGPLYLWLLPLISVPLIIYLLNRRKTKNVYYSTLRFLKDLNKDSLKKINLINNLLLIIRTLIVLFFILMFTRPTLNSNSYNNKSSSLYILIDNSYSMYGIIDKYIKKNIKRILKPFDKSNNIKIILLENEIKTIYDNSIEKLNIDILKIDKSLKNNNLKSLNHILGNDTNINKHVFILSDGQDELIQEINNIDNFYDANVSFLKLENNIENLSINNIKINNELILPGQIFSISALIQNTGYTDINNAQFDLYINNIKVGQKFIDIDNGKSKEIDYEINLPNYGEHLCEIRFAGNDDIDIDNTFYSRFYIEEKIDIDLISNEENVFIKNILNAYNYEETNKININRFNLDAYLDAYNKYSILLINGFDSFNKRLLNQLYENNFKNYKIIIFPTMSDLNLSKFNSLFNELSYKESKRKSANDNTFFDLDLSNIKNLKFNRMFSESENRNIKIFNYIASEYDGNTIIKLNNDDFLLNHYSFKNLEIYLFSISMNLESSNFPLKGSSIGLIKNIITNDDFIKFYNIDRPLRSMNIENGINLISPSNNIFYNNKNLSKTTTLNEIGFYQIERESSPKYIPVNLSYIEYNSPILRIDSIKTIFKEKIYSTNSIDNLIDYLKRINYNYDLWKVILYIILLLIIIEMYLCTRIKNND